MTPTIHTKKIFLYALIVSVIISAILGILGILRGSGGWFELRIFLTTVTISAASICGLACGAYLERQTAQLLPLAGIFLALLAGTLMIVAIWIEPHSDTFWKTSATIVTLAVSCAHLSLLSLARVGKRFGWVRYANPLFIFGVAAIIIWCIFTESNSQEVWKLLAITAIGAASMTVLTPIFHWLSRHDQKESSSSALESIDEELNRLRARIVELEKQKQALS